MQSANNPSPNDSNATSPSSTSRKRKTSTAGSRGVASLTPEQLAKKRANDREAQRAIRERTKQTIEKLERRIQELTSQQPYQELQAVVRQKDALQAENDEIRRRLASILSIIQPVVGAQDLATAAQNNIQPGLVQNPNEFGQDPYSIGTSTTRSFSTSPTLLANAPKPTSYLPQFATQDVSGENRVWHTSRDAVDLQRDNLQRGLDLNDRGERLSFEFLLDHLGQKTLQVPSLSAHNQPTQPRGLYPSISANIPENHPAPWTILPKNVSPTCPLDGILLNFLQTRRQEVSSGMQKGPDVPAYPSVASMLNPEGGHQIDTLSQLMTDIISKFPNLNRLPEQAGNMFLMFLLMRWQLYPTQENYERIPEWYTPRPSQLFTPHPAWMDNLPWPKMRDKVVANYQAYPFENWFIPFTSGMSLNWPYDDADCLLSNPETDEVVINPVFDRHIRRLENWSLGPAFAQAYPDLADTCIIRRKEEKEPGRTQ